MLTLQTLKDLNTLESHFRSLGFRPRTKIWVETTLGFDMPNPFLVQTFFSDDIRKPQETVVYCPSNRMVRKFRWTPETFPGISLTELEEEDPLAIIGQGEFARKIGLEPS